MDRCVLSCLKIDLHPHCVWWCVKISRLVRQNLRLEASGKNVLYEECVARIQAGFAAHKDMSLRTVGSCAA